MTSESNEIELADIGGLTVRVTFDLPFCLYLEDGGYEINRGSWLASIHLERVAQTNLDPRLGIAEGDTELVRDRHGRLRFSKMVIEMPGKLVTEIELRRKVAAGELEAQDGVVSATFTTDRLISEFGNVAFEEALGTANRFIEVYRHVTDQFQVGRIPAEEIFKADIQWYQDGEPLGGTWRLGFGHGMSLEPKGFDPMTLERLRSWLSSTNPVPLPFELFLDAKDRLDRKDDRLAVIDARTALEVFLDQILLTYLSVTSFTIAEAGKLLDVDVGHHNIQEFEEALQRSSINRKLGHALNQAIRLDIHNGTPELWKRWLSAKEVRERGAHRGQSIEHDEAVEAVNCMGEILSNMRDALRNADWCKAMPTATVLRRRFEPGKRVPRQR
jgi:hypothetical protein